MYPRELRLYLARGSILWAYKMTPMNVRFFCNRSVEYTPLRWKKQHFPEPFECVTRGSEAHEACNELFVQILRYPQFQSMETQKRTITWAAVNPRSKEYCIVSEPKNIKRANSFMNYKCACSRCGEGKGWFYELNLFTSNVCAISNHHKTTVRGVIAARNTEDDGETIPNKGNHWVFG